MREETGEDLSNYAARIGYKGYESFKAALDAAKVGETISLMKDADLTAASLYPTTSSYNGRLWILKNITIDGCNHEVTVTNYGFGICTSKATFKNITIKTDNNGQRCVDIRNGQPGIGNFVEELTLDHVFLDTTVHKKGSGIYDQPLTVGGNSTNFKDADGKVRRIKINVLNHSAIQTNNESVAYYAIISFNPIELNLKDSTIKGWANIYLRGASSSYGSKGSIVNIDNCELHSNNIYHGSSNAFAMIMLEDGTSTEKIVINVKNTRVHLDANSDQKQGMIATSNGYKYFDLNLLEGNKLYFNDSPTAVAFFNSINGAVTVANGNEVYSAQVESTRVENLLSDSQELHDDGEGKYTVVAK